MIDGKLKSVLVAVDFSAPSKSAVKQARHFAKKLSVPLYFIHVFEDPFVGEERFKETVKSLKAHNEKQVRRFYKVTKSESVIVECGGVSEKILDLARKLSSPLIVAGHRGVGSSLGSFLLGSTAEKLVMNSKHPVWVERGKGAHSTRSALIPTDLADRAIQTEEVIRKMGLGDRKREIFHVISPAVPVLDFATWKDMSAEVNRLNQEALDKFKADNPKISIKEEWGDVSGELNKRAKKFDFIALSPREHRGFFGGFGSVTTKLVRNSPIPLLVIP